MPARRFASLTWSTLRNALGGRHHRAHGDNVIRLASRRFFQRKSSLSSRAGARMVALGTIATAIFFTTLFALNDVMPSLLDGLSDKERSIQARPQLAPLGLGGNTGDYTTATFRLRIGVREESGRVIDGDTLAVGRRRIRLHGIDAPEIGQSCQHDSLHFHCGICAAQALAGLVAGHRLTCDAASTDRYGRQLAICIRSDGLDVNRAMVVSGWALAYRRYGSNCGHVEDLARLRRQGLWAGSFTEPETWRCGTP